jgi:hypothetical protein
VVRCYALVIGEGWRFAPARHLFWDQFDGLWRQAFVYLSNNSDVVDSEAIDQQLDHQLLKRLKQV